MGPSEKKTISRRQQVGADPAAALSSLSSEEGRATATGNMYRKCCEVLKRVSSNRLLLVLSRLCQTQINSIAAKYGIVQPLVNVSCTRIKWHVWDTFACNVL